jgi:hypothetical protein
MKNLPYRCILLLFFLVFACEEKPVEIEPPLIKFKVGTLSISQKLGEKKISCSISYENPFVRLDQRPSDIGICWSESSSKPTINDLKKEVKIVYASYYDGVGQYENPFVIENLEVGKSYYFDTYIKLKDSVYYGRNYGGKIASYKVIDCETTTKQMPFRRINNTDGSFYFDLYSLFYTDNHLYGLSIIGETYMYDEKVNKWIFKNLIDPLLPSVNGSKRLSPFKIKDEIYCNFQSNDYVTGLNKVWKYDAQKEYWEGVSVLTNKEATNLSYLFSTDSSAIFYTTKASSLVGNIVFWEYNPQKNTLKNAGVLDPNENYIVKDFVKNGNEYYFVLNSPYLSSTQTQIVKYDFPNKKIINKSLNNLLNTTCFESFPSLTQNIFSYKNKFYSFIGTNADSYFPSGSKSLIVNQLYAYDEKLLSFQAVNRTSGGQSIFFPRFFPTNDKLYCIMKNNLYEVTLE